MSYPEFNIAHEAKAVVLKEQSPLKQAKLLPARFNVLCPFSTTALASCYPKLNCTKAVGQTKVCPTVAKSLFFTNVKFGITHVCPDHMDKLKFGVWNTNDTKGHEKRENF